MIPVGDAVDDLFRASRPQMGVTSYDDTCKDGLIRRKILAKHDPEFFIAMTDSHLWKTYIDVYDRLLKASSFPTVLTFTNTNGEIVDLNIAFEMMQDSLLTAVPRASEELSVLATTTMKELRVAVGKCCAAMDMSEDQVGRISAKTEKSNRAYNRQVEDILANWALKLKELSVKIAKNAHHEDTQNAVKKQVDGMLPELVDARVKTHIASFTQKIGMAGNLCRRRTATPRLLRIRRSRPPPHQSSLLPALRTSPS